jgi:transposase InsO family protein
LTLKPHRKARRSKAAANRMAPTPPAAANERWAMDFIHDTLAGGGKIRVLSVIDISTREYLALAVESSFGGDKVAAVLSDLRDERGMSPRIMVDNGTEFTSRALDHCAYWNKVELDFTVRASRWTTRTLRPFTGPSGESASHSTGSQISRMHAGRFRTRGETTTTTGRTAT